MGKCRSRAEIILARPVLIIGSQDWAVACAATQGLPTIAEVSGEGRAWVNATLNRVRRAWELLSLRGMQKCAAGSQHLLSGRQQRWLTAPDCW